MAKLRAEAYNNTTWRKLRLSYLVEHPLCEECLKNGIVNAGSVEKPLNIHHKKSPFKGGTLNKELLLDYNNLMTVCPQCHQKIHNQKKATAAQIIKALDELMAEIPD